MTKSRKSLWNYGTLAALGAAGSVFTIGLISLLALQRELGWPDEATMNMAVLLLFFASLVPLGLRLLDFLAENRAVVGSKWFNLDLSRVDLTKVAPSETALLPANLGITGPVISDTAPMDIIGALRRSTQQAFAVVNIGEGDL